MILTAQAILAAGVGETVTVATDNVGHLARFVDAQRWEMIVPLDGRLSCSTGPDERKTLRLRSSACRAPAGPARGLWADEPKTLGCNYPLTARKRPPSSTCRPAAGVALFLAAHRGLRTGPRRRLRGSP